MEASDLNPERTEREAERLKQARVLRAASHDLRGPLANIRSYASLLADPRLELNDKARRAVEVITRNADKALALLREFIDSEQVERGILELPLQPVPLRPALDRAVRGAAPGFEEKGLTLKLMGPTELVLEAEAMALEHILRVLLDHAAERSPPGNRVQVQVSLDGGEVSVAVIDHGPELSPSERASLFDREAHLERRPKLGTGFRLSLAQAEAQTLGGQLRVRSGRSQTSLELRLPAARG